MTPPLRPWRRSTAPTTPPVQPPTADPLRATDGALVRLTDVRVHYPGPPPVRALDGVTLTVRAGERVAVTGPSGSGKSTLLNTIGLLEHPTEGERVLAGHDTTTLGDRALARLRANTLGFVFQSFHLIPDRTAAEKANYKARAAAELAAQEEPTDAEASRARTEAADMVPSTL